jgi:hypothetical protein
MRPDGRGGDRPSRRRRGLRSPVGAGALIEAAGLVCFLLALMVLPWFQAEGEDVTLADLRTSFTIPETQPEDLVSGAGEDATGSDGVTSPDEIDDAAAQAARDTAAEAAADTVDSGKARYLELYVERLWAGVAVALALSVLFSTILAPRSFALSLLLGFRRLSGLVIVLAGIAHGVALWVVFTGDGAPDPLFGIWLGVGGLAAMLVGCILGPKR